MVLLSREQPGFFFRVSWFVKAHVARFAVSERFSKALFALLARLALVFLAAVLLKKVVSQRRVE